MSRKQQIIKQAIAQNIIDESLSAIGIIDFKRLEQTVTEVYNAFGSNFYHTFAVKANALVSVLTALRKYGMGAEVASAGELKIALSAGYLPSEIIYDSPAKTIDDLRTCIEHGIAINIDNLQELARIDALFEQYPDSSSVIGFRVNPQIGAGDISSTSTATATSKFGYPLADGDNRAALIAIYQQRPWLTSLHTHSGSQGCSLDLLATGVAALYQLSEEINQAIGAQQIKRLDIGGGLAVNFASEEISPTFKQYADVLQRRVPALFSGKYQVKTEFGRAIIAKNGFIITRVEYTKSVGGRHIAITHAGAQILTRSAFLPKSWPLRITGFANDGQERTSDNTKVVATDVAGPCCFAGDLVCVDQQLPMLQPNDYVLIHDTGGYYFTNHFDYNSLPRVAVFGLNGQDETLEFKCIRRADSLDDVLNKM